MATINDPLTIQKNIAECVVGQRVGMEVFHDRGEICLGFCFIPQECSLIIRQNIVIGEEGEKRITDTF